MMCVMEIAESLFPHADGGLEPLQRFLVPARWRRFLPERQTADGQGNSQGKYSRQSKIILWSKVNV